MNTELGEKKFKISETVRHFLAISKEDLFNLESVGRKGLKWETIISHINFVLKHSHLMYQLWLLLYAWQFNKVTEMENWKFLLWYFQFRH